VLVARVATNLCAFPIEHVVETMRPGAIEDGMAMHRGDRVPVVDAAALIGASSAPRRCVVVRVGGGRASVLVDEVLGVQRLESQRVIAMKALFGAERMASVSDELRVVLGSVRVMDEAASE
jgi:chemotaxis signal transduction protein